MYRRSYLIWPPVIVVTQVWGHKAGPPPHYGLFRVCLSRLYAGRSLLYALRVFNAFLCVFVHFCAFLCIFVHFCAFLYIFVHFWRISVNFCASVNFSAYLCIFVSLGFFLECLCACFEHRACILCSRIFVLLVRVCGRFAGVLCLIHVEVSAF